MRAASNIRKRNVVDFSKVPAFAILRLVNIHFYPTNRATPEQNPPYALNGCRSRQHKRAVPTAISLTCSPAKSQNASQCSTNFNTRLCGLLSHNAGAIMPHDYASARSADSHSPVEACNNVD
jgi:hypothetical protein